MKILLQSARIIDSNSPHHQKKVDILVEGGHISQIKSTIKAEEKFKIIKSDHLTVSPGWLDMQANLCDPGFEYKEDLQSGLQAAANGGFTGICTMPSTHPPINSKTQIDYILNKSRGSVVEVYPFGTLSHKQDGKDISEMYDMKSAGAVGFTDDKQAVQDSGFVLRALQYSNNIGSFVSIHCNDYSLSTGGQMNEGEQSTKLGLKGIPGLSEEIMLQKLLSILEYSGGHLHVPTVSTKKSVELLKDAKQKGLPVTAGVSVHNLFLDEGYLNDFDTRFKLDPPLRTREDIEALKKGLLNGTIDVVVSDHRPEDVESKDLEFDLASFGATGLETLYSAFQTSCGKKIELDKMIEILAVNPRKILGTSVPVIKEGEKANITVFDPVATRVVAQQYFYSKSYNNPYLGMQLTGKVIGVIRGTQLFTAK